MPGYNGKALTWAAHDYSDPEEAKMEKFCLRLKSKEEAEEFSGIMQGIIDKLSGGSQNQSKAQAPAASTPNPETPKPLKPAPICPQYSPMPPREPRDASPDRPRMPPRLSTTLQDASETTWDPSKVLSSASKTAPRDTIDPFMKHRSIKGIAL